MCMSLVWSGGSVRLVPAHTCTPVRPVIAPYRYGGSVKDVKAGAIPADAFVLDVGGETRDTWADVITTNTRVGTIVLYGPLGLVEVADTSAGTREVGV